jgi:hypothetical protein
MQWWAVVVTLGTVRCRFSSVILYLQGSRTLVSTDRAMRRAYNQGRKNLVPKAP